MRLTWMGQYRPLIEAYIRAANAYARKYKNPVLKIEGHAMSAADIQVLEYVLENEELNLPMSGIAARLGITRGAFSKTAARLCAAGLIEKRHPEGDARRYSLFLTPEGVRVYEHYAAQIYESLFSHMMAVAGEIPSQHIESFIRILDIAAKGTGEKQLL